MSRQPGEIWLADLGIAAKARPVVIVSRQNSNPPRSLVLYVPLTPAIHCALPLGRNVAYGEI
jgi:mRNA interferase MazF